MKRVIRLTESDLVKIVKRVINEQPSTTPVAFIELNTGNVVKMFGGYEEKDNKLVSKSPVNFTLSSTPTTTQGLEKKVLTGNGLQVTALVDCKNKKINSLTVNTNSIPDTSLIQVFDATQKTSQITPLKGKQQVQSSINGVINNKTVSVNTFCRV